MKIVLFLGKMYDFSFSWCVNHRNPNSYIPQVRYDMNHIYLISLVVLKRPGFQSQKYGMPSYTVLMRFILKDPIPCLH